MPVILALIPTLFGKLWEAVSGNIGTIASDTVKMTLLSRLSQLVFDSNTRNSIISEIEAICGKLQDDTKLKLQADIDSILSNTQIDLAEANSSSFFVAGARPFLFWGLSVGAIFTCTVEPIVSYLHQCFIEQVYVIQPMNSFTFYLMCGLCGLHIGTRTYEKLKGEVSRY